MTRSNSSPGAVALYVAAQGRAVHEIEHLSDGVGRGRGRRRVGLKPGTEPGGQVTQVLADTLLGCLVIGCAVYTLQSRRYLLPQCSQATRLVRQLEHRPEQASRIPLQQVLEGHLADPRVVLADSDSVRGEASPKQRAFSNLTLMRGEGRLLPSR
ncbi:hypothetical protein ACFCWG_48090, partial [Streptomyces sp. NPDC056390]|uniref:hypothetical protein n=1 Tax=Streptomyces sp. NPDC056390 TaxID=3345806 RepID=UPI0035D96886